MLVSRPRPARLKRGAWWLLAVFLALVVVVLVGIGTWRTDRRAAHRIADLLDQQPVAAAPVQPGATEV